MTAYYNEIDLFAAQTLRNLIDAGHIAPGVVDTRSIEDVLPHELAPFTQCHFFAGVGVWSHALRQAGWPDDKPVWTASCPCQPFSAAGEGAGFTDERHLWPALYHLVAQRRPATVLGEQVASKVAEPWLDLVCADLEGVGYAFGAVAFPAAGVGAPHIRDRIYWVADASGQRREWRQGAAHRRVAHGGDAGRIESHDGIARPGEAGLRLADNHGDRCPALPEPGKHCAERHAESRGAACGLGHTGSEGLPARERGALGATGWGQERRAAEQPSVPLGGLADAGGKRRQQDARSAPCDENAHGIARWQQQQSNSNHKPASNEQIHGARSTGPVNGHWANADWLLCRDGKWRPVEPGTFPLAHGAPARVGRLRAYGNAINAKAAQAFIESVIDMGY